MGHSINYYTEKVTTEKALNTFIHRITDHAYDPRETSRYHGNMTIHRDKVCRNYDEAYEMIKTLDDGWYSDHAVKYIGLSEEGNRKVYETNCKRDEFIKSHSIHNRSSAYIGCPTCGSKLFLQYVKGEKCPLCNTDLRPKSTIDKIEAYDKKVKDIKKKSQQVYWLAKVEYHV